MSNSIATRPQHCCCTCGTSGETVYRDLIDYVFGATGQWNFRKCLNTNCGLIWLDPAPVVDNIAKLYKNYHTHALEDTWPLLLRGIITTVRSAVLTSSYGYDNSPGPRLKTAGKLLSRIHLLRERIGRTVMWLNASHRGRILDIGCGNGNFLTGMRELGWDVMGLEPDPEAASVASKKLDLEILCSDLKNANLAECAFDAITMNNVLEHLPDPFAILRECYRILKVNGRLVILTPNTESLGHIHFRQDWRGLEPPRHFFLFNNRNIKLALENVGFRLTQIRTTTQGAASILARSRELKRFRLCQNEAPSSGTVCIQKEKKKLVRCIGYQLWESLMFQKNREIGEEILAIATKDSNRNANL